MISNKGFSLVEILIAILVVALSGVGTLKLYSYMEVEKANAAMFVEAKLIAESQLALLQTVNTTGSICTGKTFANIQDCVNEQDEGSPFTVTVTSIKSLTHESAAGIVETYGNVYKVTVTWADRNNEGKTLAIPVSVSKYTNLLE
ncbi:prepilin-type N-terminal cleavage/methylation domain-containing protein [Enterovibrio sp. ZSDZ42]|uniref:Prepilin-type N-terminal cleavage/methylation domain-containing protein n=1 Tax=Enterovibrio gelatinilyticus TaxID=2899819 RepID=A0ABT5R8U4_9GAMM|nr:prepilin-type N-terminal cleavage/methylation domain-containing protein [Enterovibrio sp. ZSDZ42]MDD1795942.1 prepilin-type N-terminal cleavage/methylation domain-containing protein [Enterovibrio sp. ZSDZ42]